MADSVQLLENEEDDCITPRQSTTITFKYPSIPVDGTPDSWLSQSLLIPMASTQDDGSVRSNDDTLSSLDDSAYDLLDDTSYGTTDDETQSRMTESVSSAGENVLLQPEVESSQRTLSANVGHSSPSDRPISMENAGQNDMLNSMTRSLTNESASEHEPFEDAYQQEGRVKGGPETQGPIVFQNVHHGEGTYVLEPLSTPANTAVTVKQHMADENLTSEEPYRLMYVGSAAAKESIVRKISAALAAVARDELSGPPRYNIVPVPSFEDPTSCGEPVLLDWSGYGIVVYHCTSASFVRKDEGHDAIALTMADHSQIESHWDGHSFSTSEDWNLPDIAIFFLSGQDGISDKQTRRFARSFVAKHNIPLIIISETASWKGPSDAMTIDHSTPHICIQTEFGGASHTRVVKRLPIDISTFLRLDPMQMNTNLAYLAQNVRINMSETGSRRKLKPEKRSEVIHKGGVWSKFADFFGIFDDGEMDNLHRGSQFPLRLVTLVSACLMLGLVFARLFTPPILPWIDKSPATGAGNEVSTSDFQASATIVATTPSSLSVEQPASLIPVSINKPKTASATSATTDLASFLLDSPSLIVNNSEKFQVHVIGDSHIVLKPPYWFSRLRKTPKLHFNVTQASRALNHQVSTLFDGVYALKIASNEAHGSVNISIWTTSKPKISESFEVDFGKSWLTAVGWKKAAQAFGNTIRQDLNLIQNSLKASYGQSTSRLSSFMNNSLAQVGGMRKGSKVNGAASQNRTAFTTDLILGHTWELSRNVSRVLSQQRNIAARGAALQGAIVRQKFSKYFTSKTHLMRCYVQAASSAYETHVKNTQKAALKLWWGVAGLPKQRPVLKAGNEKAAQRGAKLRKRASR